MKKLLMASAVGLYILAPLSVTAADYTQVFTGTTSESGKVSLLSPHYTLHDVVSKYNQPRNIGTNPHRGTDLQSDSGTEVLPIWDGWVTYANDTDHEIDIRLDLNDNNIADDDTYLRYDHLSDIYVSPGQFVRVSDVIARSGNEGGTVDPHLHFGIMKESGNGGRPDYWVRNEPFFRNEAGWDSGKRLDFTSFSTWKGGNTASLYAYAYDESIPHKQPIEYGDVVIFHRKDGTNAWASTTAAKNVDEFYADLSKIYPVGTKINWMARANRTNIKANSGYYWAFHEPKFAQPDFTPSSSYTFAYFVNTMQ